MHTFLSAQPVFYWKCSEYGYCKCEEVKLTSGTSKMAIGSWYFPSFSDLTRQIRTAGVKNKGIKIRCVRQKSSIKRDIELAVAICDDVSVMHLSMVCPRMGGGQRKGNLTFSVFKSQFPTLKSPFWVKFPSPERTNWHSQLSLLQHWASLERNNCLVTKWWYLQTLCISPSVEDTF